DLVKKYIEHLINTVDVDFSGLKIVVDCAYGAAYRVAPEVLERVGAEILVVNNYPDGEKINLNCGSTHPEIIQKKVRQEKADLGIAHDGDADRVLMVDEQGQLVDGDKIMAICALELLSENKLKGNTLVTTAYSNLGLREVIERNGGRISITPNGDRYVLQEMISKGYNLGGEQSGHIIFLDHNKTGDGLLTALQTVQVVKKSGKSLSELARVMVPWPQRLANVKVKHKEVWKENDTIRRAISQAETELGEKGRVFIRASGTEPVIRVMLEGKDEAKLKELENNLVSLINKELN
ncbi:MAG: phosphoglucosamine mutase, partial [Halanaerobiales bacterium]